ncbi:MAG: cation-translocating P-type ATPase [Candidatus Micrarchaeota archaeon]
MEDFMEEQTLESQHGLSESEARVLLKRDGFNELPSDNERGLLKIIFEVMREPMFLLLVGGSILYFILGDVHEAILLAGFVLVVIGITLYQERKTEHALQALKNLSSPRALVIRDSVQKRIPGREIVLGDILVLEEGDRIPADATILSCSNLQIDESLLTGESISVRKSAVLGNVSPKLAKPGGDGLPFIYSGTVIVKGHGIARVHATGMRTELGKIGKALQKIDVERTPLQKETDVLVSKLAIVGLFLCVLVAIVYSLTRGSFIHGLLAGVAMAMAMLPEEFPVVLTVFFALGAWRMSQRNVLTSRVAVIEALGSATVLCVDKTGTLTMNRMAVKKLFASNSFYSFNKIETQIPENFHELMEFSILASQRNPFEPMEKALKGMGEQTLARTEHLHSDWSLVREYPLSESLLAMSHVWKSPGGKDYIIAVKGAPEAIADLCHLSESEQSALLARVHELANEGLRIIGVAKANFKEANLPREQHNFEFQFLGLIGFEDPVREGVHASLSECYEAGIRVIMITGDYPGTALNIASQIGLSGKNLIMGSELDKMSESELKARINETSIFARVVPEQKLRIVGALKSNGEIVAMTGDGVNDAPALKSAHIGIAMGERGTDVAREASSLVLLDDAFSSIVEAVRMGRRILGNLKKAMAYIIAVHIPIAGMSLIPVLFNLPLALLPVHIAFLELIIDPACSIVFEAEREEKDAMKKPPRDPKKPIFGGKTFRISILQGVGILLIMLVLFLASLYRGNSEAEARTISFVFLVFANLALILTNRSWSRTIPETLRAPNKALWGVLLGALAFLALILYVPILRTFFRFAPLSPADLALCFACGFASILWFELMKFANARSFGLKRKGQNNTQQCFE